MGRRRWAPLLAAIGPGLIAASADNDAGGITTCSLAGAKYGYSILWVLIVITLSLAVTQEMGARMGVVTGKGFGDLIREKFSARWAAFGILTMLLANLSTTIAEFAGVAASMLILGVKPYVSVPLAALAVAILVTRFDYHRVQKVFLTSSVLYLTYVLSGILAHPDWGFAARSILHPNIPTDPKSLLPYLVMVIGTIGTTITPWGQFFIQSYVVEKRLRTEDLAYARADVYVGAFVTDFISFFIMVACAATLYQSGHRDITDAAHAAQALEPLAGSLAAGLFAFGLLNASLLGAAILPLTSAYATCETFGWEAGIDKSPRQAPIFFGIFLFLILGGGTVVVFLQEKRLVQIILASQVLNGILLPAILIFALRITNDRSVMGKYTNSRVFNFIAIATTVVLILLTVLVVATSLVQVPA
jgi:NRAMP (natural resistance-associated macrophage protein)-like metal ion transporter